MEEKKDERIIPTVQLGGRVWFLKITHQVLERFSSIARCSLRDFDVTIERYDMMVLLLWLMMAEQQADLRRDTLEGWLQKMPIFESIDLVTNATAAAVEYSFPAPEPQTETQEGESTDDPTAKDI